MGLKVLNQIMPDLAVCSVVERGRQIELLAGK